MLCVSNFCYSLKVDSERSIMKPVDYIKTMGFRCIQFTGIEAALRLNNDNDIECWSENGKDCIWGLNTEAKCMEAIDQKNIGKLNPISCGIKHKEIHGTNGYDVKGHWCQKALKNFFGKYHCPSESGLKEAVKLDKHTGEVKCLSKDMITCYTGKDLETVCADENRCKKKRMERKVFVEGNDPMAPQPKNKLESIGCEANLIDKDGHPGYQNPGKHWCKDALAFLRYLRWK